MLLAFFLGYFGAHRFYSGRYALGVLYLLTFGLFFFGWFVDLALALFGKLKDGQGRYICNW